jgi:uncharacterized protein YecT (DUF1311 family)
VVICAAWLICDVGQKMSPRILIFVAVAATLHAAETEEAELSRLLRAANSAKSQVEMNETSGALVKYWDRLLSEVEAQFLSSFDVERAMLFRSAQKAWREFRLAEAKLQADASRRGSIQPLVYNSAYSFITQQRVKELRAWFKADSP